MDYTALFQPGKIGTLKVKNRLVMPPMVRNYADEKGFVTDRYAAHIERIARGGVGMMILEASFISPEGKGFVKELGVHTDEVIPGLKKLVDAAHKHGAVIGPQLYHAGRQTSSKVTGKKPLAPSAIPDPTINELPVELSVKEIGRLVRAYAQAAKRAKRAGCDFVEIHGAHGYLITQFLSSFSNKRIDEYGGPLKKRMRFLFEVLAAVQKAVGKDFPLSVRLSADEMVRGGLTIKDTIVIAKELQKQGVDVLHISVGNYASYAQGKMISPMAVEDGPLIRFARAVKKGVKIPVIAVDKIRTPELAARTILKGSADFIAIGRTLLADPDWPNKVKEGRTDEIMPCIACNQGCISRLFAQQDVWCTVNPETSREQAFKKKVLKKKRVVVIGGGPAGLQAAKTAAQRGHTVVLFEKSGRLGGQLFASESAPHREGWHEFREALVRDVKRLPIAIRLKKEYTLENVRNEKPDGVIIAVGSLPTTPKIPGAGRTNVLNSREILEGKKKAKGAVVVIGGGCAGAQTAEFLADKKHSVILVEASDAVAKDAPSDDRTLLLARLQRKGVTLMTNTKVVSIGPKDVVVENHLGSRTIPANTVVLCLGSRPNDGLINELKKVIKKVHVIGDAVRPRRVTEAVAEGALAALSL